jgi:undecaprenyl-diphosphatase
MGTFVGAAAYFRHELARYVAAGMRSIRRRSIRARDERMGWLLLLSSVPGAIAGALFEGVIGDNLGKPVLIGVMLVVFGLVLYAADRSRRSATSTTSGCETPSSWASRRPLHSSPACPDRASRSPRGAPFASTATRRRGSRSS